MVNGISLRRDQLWYFAVNLIEEELKTCPLSRGEEEHGNRIQMKYHQLVSNLSCFGEIIAQMYEKKKLTQQEFEYIHDLQSTPIRANEALLTVIAKKPRDVYECFLTLLMATDQSHLYQMLAPSNDSLQEASNHKDLIRRNFTWLLEKLDTENELIFLLYERNVLTFSEKEQIACKKGQFQKNVSLLEVLNRKPTENFDKFLTALEETKQSHIVIKLKQSKGLEIPSKPGEKKHNSASSSLKPFPPPKPCIKSTVIQLRDKSPLRSSHNNSEVINLNHKVKNNQFKKKFQRIESRLQTEISTKVIVLRPCTSHRSADMSETCLLHILRENHQLRNELTKSESDNHEKLAQLDTKSSQYSAAISINDTLKGEIRSLKEELKHQKNLNQLMFNQQELIEEKLAKAQDEIFGLKKKCNILKEENHLKGISIKQLESQLSSAESEKQSLEKRLHELGQQLSLAREEKQSRVIQGKSLKETYEKLRLIEIENEGLKKACDQLIKQNQHLKEVEEKLLQEKENANEFQAKLHESALVLSATEKECEILKHTLEEMKQTELRLQSRMQEELDMEKRLRIEKETVLKEALDNLEEATRQLEVFQNVNKVNSVTLKEKEKFPTEETLVVRNNHQFLVENLDSSRLIDLLHEKNCITDEERDHLNYQPCGFYRNDELLHWMRTITFKQDKGLIVLECLRETKQDFIADLLLKGGVVVKCSISCNLASRFSVNLQKKLSSEQAQTLKEKEESVALKLNQAQVKPSSGSILKTISELFGDELQIAPYCHREENGIGIVIWFWCHSQNSLHRLQGMYVSGVLIERLATLFKQLSTTGSSTTSTTAAPVPHTVAIHIVEFIKAMAIIDYKRDPALLLTIRTKAAEKNQAGIYGITILDDEVFVVNECSSSVEVYNVTSLDFKRSFVIDNLEEPRDIVSCPIKKSLYIVDGGHHSQPMKILRIDANGYFLKKLWQGDDWGRLSVTKESNIILAVLDKHKILEMTSDGQLIRDIKLAYTSPWHAIKLTSGHFVVSYGKGVVGLCIVDTEGKVVICHDNYYREPGSTCIFPIYMALDKAGSVLVVDEKGGRVLLLTSTLKYQRELVTAKHGLKNPRRVLLDESNGRLLVAENTGDVLLRNDGQLRVFDIGGTNVLREKHANTQDTSIKV